MIYRYEYLDQFDGLEREDFSRYSGNLVLWGAGKIGSITAYLLKQKGIEVLAFVDMFPAKQGTEFCGLKVISPETFLKDYGDSELIITTVGRADVIDWLQDHNFSSWHDAWSLLLEFDFGDYSYQNQLYMGRMISRYFHTVSREKGLKNKYIVNSLRIFVTSRCTLRCRECSTFVPYLENHRDDDWKKMVSDIKLFLDAVHELPTLDIMGGEPLLHPDLDKLVAALGDEPRIRRIQIVTNGTILPGDSLIQALKNEPRSYFQISSYGKLSSRMEEIIRLFEENGMQREVIDYKTWYKNSEVKKLNETDAELRKKFSCCMEDCGMVLWDGKLFFCATLPFLLEAGAFPKAEENFYDMRNSEKDRPQLVKEIYQYANRSNTSEFIDACRYCTGKTTTNFAHAVPVAEQAHGILRMPDIGEN